MKQLTPEIRKKYEKKVFDLLDQFDPSGFNSNKYKKAFSKMNNTEFVNMAKTMLDPKHDDFIFSLDINERDTGSNEITLEKIKKISEKYKIPLEEYVIMPFRNPNDPNHPMVTLTPVPICYLQIRRFFQQMLQHKNAISNDNGKINPLTGQVVGEDKTASTTNVQTYALTVTNEKNCLKEFLGPRSDDSVSKQQMLTEIERTGTVRLGDLDIKTHNKQSVNTVETCMKAACLDVKFEGNDNYTLE